MRRRNNGWLFCKWKDFRIKKPQTKHTPFAHRETYTEFKQKKNPNNKPTNIFLYLYRSTARQSELMRVAFYYYYYFPCCFVAVVCKNIFRYIDDSVWPFLLVLPSLWLTLSVRFFSVPLIISASFTPKRFHCDGGYRWAFFCRRGHSLFIYFLALICAFEL